jgi:hypothetical protein
MSTIVVHTIGAATLWLTLTAWAVSAHTEEIMNEGAVVGNTKSSEEQSDRVDFEKAKPLPLPAAPDSAAAQAEKDLIDNLTRRHPPSSIPAPAGHEAGSEGNGTTTPDRLRTPSVAPNTNNQNDLD